MKPSAWVQLCDPEDSLPRMPATLRALGTDRRPHLKTGMGVGEAGGERIKIEISLLFFSDKSAARNSSTVSLPSFSFVFFVSCFNIFLQLLMSPFLFSSL